MSGNHRKSSGAGLERSCDELSGDWMRASGPENGVELLEARFQGSAYRKHRHDTYAICLTVQGVQAFDYRGSRAVSLPGQVAVLHPDEVHDGNAGSDEGFGYRQVYIEPALIFDAVRDLSGRPRALPFVREPVVNNRKLASAVSDAFDAARDPLALDSLILRLAEGLLETESSREQASVSRHLDVTAVQRACEFLDAEKTRVVRSEELESVSGLSRYDLARQFRLMCGTSPYRYLLLRRLDSARLRIIHGVPLSDVAFDTGFADQAHFTRVFKSAFGLTPSQYRALRRLRRSAHGSETSRQRHRGIRESGD